MTNTHTYNIPFKLEHTALRFVTPRHHHRHVCLLSGGGPIGTMHDGISGTRMSARDLATGSPHVTADGGAGIVRSTRGAAVAKDVAASLVTPKARPHLSRSQFASSAMSSSRLGVSSASTSLVGYVELSPPERVVRRMEDTMDFLRSYQQRLEARRLNRRLHSDLSSTIHSTASALNRSSAVPMPNAAAGSGESTAATTTPVHMHASPQAQPRGAPATMGVSSFSQEEADHVTQPGKLRTPVSQLLRRLRSSNRSGAGASTSTPISAAARDSPAEALARRMLLGTPPPARDTPGRRAAPTKQGTEDKSESAHGGVAQVAEQGTRVTPPPRNRWVRDTTLRASGVRDPNAGETRTPRALTHSSHARVDTTEWVARVAQVEAAAEERIKCVERQAAARMLRAVRTAEEGADHKLQTAVTAARRESEVEAQATLQRERNRLRAQHVTAMEHAMQDWCVRARRGWHAACVRRVTMCLMV